MRTISVLISVVALAIASCAPDASEVSPPVAVTEPIWPTTTLVAVPPVEGTSAPATTEKPRQWPSIDVQVLNGVPLEGPTGLVLLVGDTLIDVDADTQRRIEGLPENCVDCPRPEGWPEGYEALDFSSFRIGEDAIIHVWCNPFPHDLAGLECVDDEVFLVRNGSTVATRIASGQALQMSPGFNGLWVTSFGAYPRCTLSNIGLDGETLRATVEFDCDLRVRGETSLGLLGWTERDGVFIHLLLDPSDLGPILEVEGSIHAVVGNAVLVRQWDQVPNSFAANEAPFELLDWSTGAKTTIPTPTRTGIASRGRVSPDGRYVAVSFENPEFGDPQYLDIRVLEMETLEWSRLPSMPASTYLKFTDSAWAPDGRLVILGEFREVEHALATWRPGDPQLAVREIAYGLDSALIVWCKKDGCG